MKITGKPELLAPAGSESALVSAVKNGADAVYFGGTLFNARMNAANFDRDGIRRAVYFCREKGVKTYVTLNTEIFDRELRSALDYAFFLYESGVDALITADLGLSALIKKHLPEMRIHASTQAGVHNAAGADEMAKLGFERVVLARELTKENILSVTERCVPETEIFIHGAICVSCSGQCLMSAMLGGRSGNRGECAQPCRMQYNGGYPLSLRDMSLSDHVPEILGLGVASLKIEGRMKSDVYVGGVTGIYRRLIDEERAASPRENERLAELFSRGGFTDGYFTGKIGVAMLGTRSEADKKMSRGAGAAGGNLPDIPSENLKALRPSPPAVVLQRPERMKFSAPFFTARFEKPSQIPEKHFFRHIFLPPDAFSGKADGIVIPPVIHESETEAVFEAILRAVRCGAEHALVGNVSHFSVAEKFGLVPHADFRMNVFNSETARLMSERGAGSVICSAELSLPQIRDLNCGNSHKGAVVYGRLPLMLLEKRVQTAGKGGARSLRDTRGAVFPVTESGKRDVLLNSVPVYMADQLDRTDSAGVSDRHMIFSTETPGEVMRVIYAYEHGTIPKEPIRRIKS
ncbi:MAG: U32 family peptidase [Clostridia bacterium]|nr:U32 family peptidase [Clostridia bacterium]